MICFTSRISRVLIDVSFGSAIGFAWVKHNGFYGDEDEKNNSVDSCVGRLDVGFFLHNGPGDATHV